MDSCPGCVYPEFYGRLEVNQVGGTLWTQRDEVFRFKASKEAEEKTYRQSRERREEKQTFFRGGGRGIPAKCSKKDRRLGGPATDGGPVPDRKDSWKWMTCPPIGRRLSLTNRGFSWGFNFHVSTCGAGTRGGAGATDGTGTTPIGLDTPRLWEGCERPTLARRVELFGK